MKKEKSIFDGIFRKNLIFTSGLLTALCAVVCTRLNDALYMSLALIFITLVSSVLTVVFLQNKSFYVQLAFDAIVSAVCYIPVYLLFDNLFSDKIENFGIYFPLIIIMSVWIFRTQRTNLNEESIFKGILRLLMFLIGAAVVMLIIGAIREFISYGTLFGLAITKVKIMESAAAPYFGLFIIGLIAAAARFIKINKK